MARTLELFAATHDLPSPEVNRVAGFAVLRVASERMTRAPQRAAARLRAVLDRRSPAAGPAA